MKRIYHHFVLWEEWPAGMWRIDPVEFEFEVAVVLMRNTARWVAAMRQVARMWPRSCEQNLSHTEHNRVAWLGQAAVCLAVGQPAVVTRKTWWQLTRGQQDQANAGAQATITEWEASQCPDNQLALMF